MNKLMPFSLMIFILVACGKAGKMPVFPQPEYSPVYSPVLFKSDDVEVKIERMDELKTDFSNFDQFVKSLNYHRLTFTPKTGNFNGFKGECLDSKLKSSYYSETFENKLIILTVLKTKNLNPVDLECIFTRGSTTMKKMVPMKKSLAFATNLEKSYDLDVLLIDNLTLLTGGQDISIKANKLVSRKGKIASALLTEILPAEGLPIQSGTINLEAKESMGDLTVQLIGQSANVRLLVGDDGGNSGSLNLKLPNLDKLKLTVNYFAGKGAPGALGNGKPGVNDLSRIELTEKNEVLEFDSDWMN